MQIRDNLNTKATLCPGDLFKIPSQQFTAMFYPAASDYQVCRLWFRCELTGMSATYYIICITSYVLHHTYYAIRITSYVLHHMYYIIHITSYVLRHTYYIICITSHVLRHMYYVTRCTNRHVALHSIDAWDDF